MASLPIEELGKLAMAMAALIIVVVQAALVGIIATAGAMGLWESALKRSLGTSDKPAEPPK